MYSISPRKKVDQIAGFENFAVGENNSGFLALLFRNCPKWTGYDRLHFTTGEDITRKALRKGWDWINRVH
jgi:coenzyme F420-0:L-glutamate ligase/coenzyme F420-1:gamma-L-glutamate ligase